MTTLRPTVSRVWASAATTSNVQDPDKFLPNKVNQGWVAEIPPYQWFNWILKRNDEFKRALVERGVAAWGGDVTYLKGALTYNDKDSIIYICLKENRGIRPDLDDGTRWTPSALQITQEDFVKLVTLLEQHIADKSNPHDVTAEQIDAYTKAQIDTLLSKYNDAFIKHLEDFDNPHKVTASEAGAVPITGGRYTGIVEFAQSKVTISGSNTGVDTTDGYVRLFNGENALGVTPEGKAVFSQGEVKHDVLLTKNFADLTLEYNPSYYVPVSNKYLPFNGDICLYEGEAVSVFSRASRGMYINYQGVPCLAEVDEPRFCKQGLLMENTAVNLVPYSNPTKDNFSCGQGADVIVNDAPWGILNMTRFNAANTWISFDGTQLPLSQSQGKTLCGSFFLRKRSSDPSMKIYLSAATDYVEVFFDESKNKGHAHVELLSPNMYRVWLEHTFPADEKRQAQLYCMCGMGDAVGGKQIEVGSHPSSWIPTAETSATRQGDSLWLEPSIGTANAFTATFICDTSLDVQLVNKIVFLDSTKGIASWFYNGQIHFRAASGKTYAAPQPDHRCRLTFTYSDKNVSIYADGVLVLSVDESGYGEDYNEFGKTYIGVSLYGGDALEGHIQDFKIWHKYLTPEQCSTL